MNLFKQIPIAFDMLTHSWSRLFFSTLGVSFSSVIMFMQMGFFNGLNDSQSNLPPYIETDLIMFSKKKDHLKASGTFTLKRLNQVKSIDGVKSVNPTYMSASYWWNPQDNSRSRVLMIGVSLDNPGFSFPEIKQYKKELRQPNTILYDRLSRRELGEIEVGTVTQLVASKIKVAGLFELGSNFTYEGHVILGLDNYYRIYGNPFNMSKVIDEVDLGFIYLKPGVDPQQVKQDMKASLPDDFDVLTREELHKRENDFVVTHTPSGIIFGIGLIVGFVIGVIICYQILFNEINDHLPQFATLKAMGHSPGFLLGIVVSEALILSCAGFFPGLLFSFFLYEIIEGFSQINMYLTFVRGTIIFTLTTFMCFISAVWAVRKVVEADPADLY